MHQATKHDFTDFCVIDLPDRIIAGVTSRTMFMTLDGEKTVKDLKIGQNIITREAGIAPLRRIRSKTIQARAVQIKAGSLGHGRPHSDMIVGPDTLIHIRDWRAQVLFGVDVATVKAKRLIDHECVTETRTINTTVYELLFDKQHILYADGLEVASAAH